MPQSRPSPQLRRQLFKWWTRQQRSCADSAFTALAAPAADAMSLSAAGMHWEAIGSAYTTGRPCATHAQRSGQIPLNRTTMTQSQPRRTKKDENGKQETGDRQRPASRKTGGGEF